MTLSIAETDALLARLREQRKLKDAPEEELRWIIAHGVLQTFRVGENVVADSEAPDSFHSPS